MAITTAQLNAGKALVLDKLFLRYPECRSQAIRIVVQSHKNGNATEKEIAKALLNQAYQAIYGISPVGGHHFIHWLRDEPLRDLPNDPTTGVGDADVFEAQAITVT